jgi:hypothetical protein
MSAESILPFTGITTGELDADVVLENNKGIYECIVMVGYTKDGAERLVSSTGDSALMVWLLERGKKAVLESADIEEEDGSW